MNLLDLPYEIIEHVCNFLWIPRDIVRILLTSRLLGLLCASSRAGEVISTARQMRSVHADIRARRVQLYQDKNHHVYSLHTTPKLREIVYMLAWIHVSYQIPPDNALVIVGAMSITLREMMSGIGYSTYNRYNGIADTCRDLANKGYLTLVSSNHSIPSLPREIIEHICNFLWKPRDIASMLLVSHTINELCKFSQAGKVYIMMRLKQPLLTDIRKREIEVYQDGVRPICSAHKISGLVVVMYIRSYTIGCHSSYNIDNILRIRRSNNCVRLIENAQFTKCDHESFTLFAHVSVLYKIITM